MPCNESRGGGTVATCSARGAPTGQCLTTIRADRPCLTAEDRPKSCTHRPQHRIVGISGSPTPAQARRENPRYRPFTREGRGDCPRSPIWPSGSRYPGIPIRPALIKKGSRCGFASIALSRASWPNVRRAAAWSPWWLLTSERTRGSCKRTSRCRTPRRDCTAPPCFYLELRDKPLLCSTFAGIG